MLAQDLSRVGREGGREGEREGGRGGTHLVLVIQKHLEGLGAIDLASCALAHNLSRVDNILQNRVLYGSQGAGTRTGALGLGGAAVALPQDGALSDDHHVLATRRGREEGRDGGLLFGYVKEGGRGREPLVLV